jgi:hypothetical protein
MKIKKNAFSTLVLELVIEVVLEVEEDSTTEIVFFVSVFTMIYLL